MFRDPSDADPTVLRQIKLAIKNKTGEQCVVKQSRLPEPGTLAARLEKPEEEIRLMQCLQFSYAKEGKHKREARQVQTGAKEASRENEIACGHSSSERETSLDYSEACHPRVVRLLAAYRTKSHFWTVLEFCDGGELFNAVASRGQAFSEVTCRRYIKDIASAVTFLHSHGVCHLDISLENLLLTGDGYPLFQKYPDLA